MSVDHFLDYVHMAEVLSLRTRDGAGWSAEAARALVNRHAELRALEVRCGPRSPRWRLREVLEWAQRHAAIVASAAGCDDCRRKAPRVLKAVNAGVRS